MLFEWKQSENEEKETRSEYSSIEVDIGSKPERIIQQYNNEQVKQRTNLFSFTGNRSTSTSLFSHNRQLHKLFPSKSIRCFRIILKNSRWWERPPSADEYHLHGTKEKTEREREETDLSLNLETPYGGKKGERRKVAPVESDPSERLETVKDSFFGFAKLFTDSSWIMFFSPLILFKKILGTERERKRNVFNNLIAVIFSQWAKSLLE